MITFSLTLLVFCQEIKVHSVACRYESVLLLRHPVEEDSGTYKIVASASKVKSKEFSFKLYVEGTAVKQPYNDTHVSPSPEISWM